MARSSLTIQLSELELGGQRLAGTAALNTAGTVESDNVSLPHPVAYAIRVYREADEVRVGGWFSTAVSISCHRCLKALEVDVGEEFELVYKPPPPVLSEEEKKLDDNELDIDYYIGDELDLGVSLVEQVLLSLPMKVLCSQDCKGLCPQCGADHNQADCGCRPGVDPRLSSLAGLGDQL